jgi:glycine/D-amino acid oxidase-like deaminating enzyme
MPTYDVIIIGGGFLGLSSAYHLARMGVRCLLLEAGDIGSGTSAACTGRAQVCEGQLDPLNIQLVREGFERHQLLEEELREGYDWRKIDLFLLIRNETTWNRWQERAAVLTPAGIPTEVVDRERLQKAEPNMNTDGLLGAAHAVEGMLNPLKFSFAYAAAAQRSGAEIRGNTPVTGLEVKGRRVTGVITRAGTYYSDKVAVMAGAWTPQITRLAGVDLPIRHTHAEALITEPIPHRVYNNIEIADFYETIHGKPRAVAIGVHQDPNGTLIITEAVTQTKHLHKRVSAWGLSAIANELLELYPLLKNVRVVRSWGRPTSFTPDENPIVGWVPELENLYAAASLVETLTTVPVLSEWMAMMIQGQNPPVSLAKYSPARFSNVQE